VKISILYSVYGRFLIIIRKYVYLLRQMPSNEKFAGRSLWIWNAYSRDIN